jgi:hypothetical protein
LSHGTYPSWGLTQISLPLWNLPESPSTFSKDRVIPLGLCYLMSLYISLSTTFISEYYDWRFISLPS